MNQFPAVDPIPVPAPVWLMKLLSLVTLALHFAAVMMLVGSLILILVLNTRGWSAKCADRISASLTLARRLPVMMTFVINLGVPPLLFAQVLYGRALYTSTVLIGAMWISVIFLLMLDYWLLYRIVDRVETNRPAWVPTTLALLVTMGIGQIYAFAMTLMLRPGVWQEMYAKTASGTLPPPHDPTTTPRWMFVMAGGLVMGGVWALLLSNMKYLSEGAQTVLRKAGGTMAGLGMLVQFGSAFMVVSSQPDFVRAGLGSTPLYSISGYAYVATTLVAGLVGLLLSFRSSGSLALSIAGLLAAVVGTIGSVVFRDGIRDLTLKQAGYDVMARTEASNWIVIGVFLVLFVVMIGVVLWLLQVMRKATPPKEQVSL